LIGGLKSQMHFWRLNLAWFNTFLFYKVFFKIGVLLCQNGLRSLLVLKTPHCEWLILKRKFELDFVSSPSHYNHFCTFKEDGTITLAKCSYYKETSILQSLYGTSYWTLQRSLIFQLLNGAFFNMKGVCIETSYISIQLN